MMGGISSCTGSIDASDDSSGTSSDTASQEEVTATAGTEGSSSGRVLTIPEGLEMCVFTPSRGTVSGFNAPLFHFRGVLRFQSQVLPLPNEPGVEDDAWLQFTLQTRSGDEIPSGEGQGSVRVEADSVPSSVYFLDEAMGWETAVYTDNPSAPTVRGDRVMIQVAYPAGSTDFSLAPIVELDKELRHRIIGFIPAVDSVPEVFRAEVTPCSRTDLRVDRLDVTLSEGVASFHTRPAFWGLLDGFTVLAKGEVDGISFEVDSYWDLEYSTGDFAGRAYGVRPMLAVRFGAEAGEPCILVVEWDNTAEDAYLARLLDCDQNELKQLTVESIDVVPGGGEARW